MSVREIAEKLNSSGGNNSSFKSKLKDIINSTSYDVKEVLRDIVKEIENKTSFSFSKIDSEIYSKQKVEELLRELERL